MRFLVDGATEEAVLRLYLKLEPTGHAILVAEDTEGADWNVIVLYPDGTCHRCAGLPDDLGFHRDEYGAILID